MKLSNFIFYTGLWIYFPVVIAICYILDTSVAITEVPGWAYMLAVIVPAILPVEITLANRKRQEYGHKDFGLRDAIGIRNVHEMETKEWQEAAHPDIPAKYLSNVPDGLIIGKYKKKTVRIPVSSDGLNCFVVGGVGSFKSVNLISQLLLNLYQDRLNNTDSKSLPSTSWMIISHHYRLRRMKNWHTRTAKVISYVIVMVMDTISQCMILLTIW